MAAPQAQRKKTEEGLKKALARRYRACAQRWPQVVTLDTMRQEERTCHYIYCGYREVMWE